MTHKSHARRQGDCTSIVPRHWEQLAGELQDTLGLYPSKREHRKTVGRSEMVVSHVDSCPDCRIRMQRGGYTKRKLEIMANILFQSHPRVFARLWRTYDF